MLHPSNCEVSPDQSSKPTGCRRGAETSPVSLCHDTRCGYLQENMATPEGLVLAMHMVTYCISDDIP